MNSPLLRICFSKQCYFLFPLLVLLYPVTTVFAHERSPSPLAATPINPDLIRFNNSDLPDPPSGGSEPTGRGSGGRRGCNNNRLTDALTPLVPLTSTAQHAVRWGLTTEAHPTIWLQTGEGFPQGALITLTMRDRNRQALYRVRFPVPKQQAGIVRFAVPPSVPPLQPNQPYTWQLSVFCNSGDSSLAGASFDTPFHLMGYIQRTTVSEAVIQTLKQAKTPLERAVIFAEYGIWYDALTLLGNQIQNDSAVAPTVVQAWSALLQQGQLNPPSKVEVLPCCTPQAN